MDGVLVVDKPSGPTSHDVVARVRRTLGISRIGHTGTLDPLATGVLPLVIGKATRLASLLSSAEKTYDAAVRLGCATATYDAAERLAGGIPPPPAPAVTREEVERALDAFRGIYLQAPPPFSAKKIDGVAAHRLARRNQPVQPAAVSVTVQDLTLVDLVDGLVRLTVTASAGFYVRSLAHEMGARLGCGAHLEALRRTRAGAFGISDATLLDVIESEGAGAAQRLLPMHALLPELPALILTEAGARRASHGNALKAEDVAAPGLPSSNGFGAAGPIRLLDTSGRLLGIAREAPGGALRPAVVLV